LKTKHSILIALTFVVALASPVQAQTFAPIPGLAFNKPFAGANPLPQTLTLTSTAADFNFRVTSSTTQQEAPGYRSLVAAATVTRHRQSR
jgi:hypothetical protein